MKNQPHLGARPGQVSQRSPSGMQTLPVGGKRDSYVYVPPSYNPAVPMPLVLLLHGAGGHAHDGLRILLHLADSEGLILLAPASNSSTWDIINRRTYDADVELVDAALAHVFARYAVERERLAICGFSDGASYALTLGLANGDLFTHVIAFSPGFIGPMESSGEPKIFISHGTEDEVLPVNPCSRSIVKQLRRLEYTLVYDEFDGGHVIPAEVAKFALDWFMGRIA